MAAIFEVKRVFLKILNKADYWSYIAGNLFYAALTLAFGVFIARWVGVEEFGRFNYLISIAAPTFILTGGGLRIFASTDVKHQYSDSEYYQFRLTSAAVASIAVIAIGGAFVAHWPLVIAYSLYRYLESVVEIGVALFQRQKKLGLAGKILCRQSLLLTGVFGLSVWIFRSPAFGFFLLIVALSGLLVLHFRRIRVQIETPRAFSIGGIFRSTWMLNLTTVALTLNINIPRFVLGKTVSLVELGIFSATLNLVFVATLFVGIFSQLNMASAGSASKKFIKRQLFLALMVGSGCLASAPFAGGILRLLYGQTVPIDLELYFLLMVYAISACLMSALNYALAAKRKIKGQLIINCVTPIFMLALFFLLQSYDDNSIKNMVWAMIVSGFSGFLLILLVMKRSFDGAKNSI